MISIGRLVEALGVTDDADLPLIERARDAALAYIQSQTNRYFGPVASSTEYTTGTGTSRLYIKEASASITAVNEYTYPGATADAIPSSGSDSYIHRIDGTEAYLLRTGSGAIWDADYEYGISYLRGYEEDGLPADIEDWLIALVQSAWASDGEEIMKSETVGGYSYTRFDAVTLDAKHQDTLKSWRRLVFA